MDQWTALWLQELDASWHEWDVKKSPPLTIAERGAYLSLANNPEAIRKWGQGLDLDYAIYLAKPPRQQRLLVVSAVKKMMDYEDISIFIPQQRDERWMDLTNADTIVFGSRYTWIGRLRRRLAWLVT